MKEVPESKEGESRWTKLSFWLCTLHLFTLSALAFAKPVFDVTARDAAFYVIRGSRPADIVTLIAIVSIAIPTALVLLEAVSRIIGRRLQLAIHFVLVGTLIAVYAAPIINHLEFADGYFAVSIISACGIFGAVLYANTLSFRRLISLASPFIILLPALFVFGSQVGKLILPGAFTWSTDEGQTQHLYLKEKPPIFFVVLDELPVISLIDEKGKIDTSRFPNLASLAETSSWYKNATAVSPTTEIAVPAILTGIFPQGKLLPNIKDHPNNLFTLLAENYKFNVYESACYLCPDNLSSRKREALPFINRLQSLLSDVRVLFLHVTLPDAYKKNLPSITNKWGNFSKTETVPSAITGDTRILSRKDLAEKLLSMKKNDRPDIFRSFISDIDPTRKDSLNFIHILLPHGPFEYLPSTNRYKAVSELGLEGATKTKDRFTGPQGLVDKYHQLHLLQLAATDKLLGELFGKLKSNGWFDESLIVITADHGASFRSNDFNREVSNRNIADIMFVPLLIKLPNQKKGEVSEADAATIDIIPTVADYLGIKLPWKASGVSLLQKNREVKTSKSIFTSKRLETYAYRDLLQKRESSHLENIYKFGLNQPSSNLFWFGEHLDLLGKNVIDLEVREGNVSLELDQAHMFDSVDLSRNLTPALIQGKLTYRKPVMAEVAISINGVIQGVAKAYNIQGNNVFTVVVPESAFKEGVNKVQGYVIERTATGQKYLVSAEDHSSKYSLKKFDIISSDGKAYPIIAGNPPGMLDELSKTSNTVVAAGWATNPQKSRPANNIVIFENESFLLAGRTTQPRPDVTRMLKNTKLGDCGFSFTLPPNTNLKKLRVFSIADRVAYELDYHKKLGLKPDYLSTSYALIPRYELKGDTPFASDGTKYSFSSEKMRGSVDIIKTGKSSVTITGWAANVDKLQPVESILLFEGDKFIASGKTRVIRPDIAMLLKSKQFPVFGFDYTIPSSKLKEIENLKVFAISEGLATEIIIQKKSRLNGTKFVLNQDTLLSESAEVINIYSTSLQGNLDVVRVEKRKVLVAGWAADVKGGVPVESLAIFSGNEFVGSGKPTINRPDVGKSFTNVNLSRCGFDFSFPMKGRDTKKLRVFAISKGSAIELQNPATAKEETEKAAGFGFTLEDDRIITADGTMLTIEPAGMQTSWDTLTNNGTVLSISGWAANVQQSKVAERILVFANGMLVASARPKAARPDVATALGNDKIEYCGFNLSFPAKSVGDLKTIRVFALHGGFATELSNAVALAPHMTKLAPPTRKPVFTIVTTGSQPEPQVPDE